MSKGLPRKIFILNICNLAFNHLFAPTGAIQVPCCNFKYVINAISTLSISKVQNLWLKGTSWKREIRDLRNTTKLKIKMSSKPLLLRKAPNCFSRFCFERLQNLPNFSDLNLRWRSCQVWKTIYAKLSTKIILLSHLQCKWHWCHLPPNQKCQYTQYIMS